MLRCDSCLPALIDAPQPASAPLAARPLARRTQGSTWAVRRRTYFTHDPHPPSLATEVAPGDVPYLRPAARYALWSDKQQVGWARGERERAER